mgnify:CR=1 FL=1
MLPIKASSQLAFRVGGLRVDVIGRGAELDRTRAWLKATSSDRTALFIEGEPGIGKTTIWSDGINQARLEDWTVLVCRPRPSDAGLSNVGITDLLRNVPDEAFADLPAPQRGPLEVATLRKEAGDGDLEPRAVGTALTALLAGMAVRGSLLLAVDDAQWLDAASARALAFALHRQDRGNVRLLAAFRIETGTARASAAFTTFESALGRDHIDRVPVGPMSVAAIHRLILET